MSSQNGLNLRIAGLGGQGVATLATVIAEVATASDVNVSAIDRLTSAMRLSPIACDVRLGCKSFAPLIAAGSADVVLGMEVLEGTMNALHYIRKNGIVLLNSEETPRTSDLKMGIPYPDLGQEWALLQKNVAKMLFVDANAIANEVTGRKLDANYVMLGVLASHVDSFPLSVSSIREAIGYEDKLRCFERGLEFTQ
jgi:indolepyruvate ferredoxin oxidoreductase, beta subunit